jgi:hypothetical protein
MGDPSHREHGSAPTHALRIAHSLALLLRFTLVSLALAALALA